MYKHCGQGKGGGHEWTRRRSMLQPQDGTGNQLLVKPRYLVPKSTENKYALVDWVGEDSF